MTGEEVVKLCFMEEKNLEQVKELIDRIADSYDLPAAEETEEMRKLTGIDWNAEDLQMECGEYWSRSSLDETAYLMFHGERPPVREVELAFWRCKPGAVLDDQIVFDKYRFGKKPLKALEALPLEEILLKIREQFTGWQENIYYLDGDESSQITVNYMKKPYELRQWIPISFYGN